MYETVLAAITVANAEASNNGWSGAELQAHVFCAAFLAAMKSPDEAIPPAPPPEADHAPAPADELPAADAVTTEQTEGQGK